MNAVAEQEEFKPKVASYWAETEEIFLSTSSLYRFSKKLKALKPIIWSLANERMGNLTKKAKEAFDFLCAKQKANLTNPTTQGIEEEKTAYIRWEKVADLEEKYFKEKSKLQWLNIGDRNNKYFHKAIAMIETRNSIREI